MQVYLHYKFGEPAPLELFRWNLVEKYHWTLDYIDSLTLETIKEYALIQDGKAKGK